MRSLVVSFVRKGRILEILRRFKRQDLDRDEMWGLKESSESRVTPRTLAWLVEVINAESIVIERLGEETRGGGKVMSSVLERLSLRWCCDIHFDISARRLVIREEIDVVS